MVNSTVDTNGIMQHEIHPLTRLAMMSAITEHDRKERSKRGYNPHALGHYCAAMARVDEMVKQGYTLRKSIITNFLGRLCDKVLKSAGQTLMSREEARG